MACSMREHSAGEKEGKEGRNEGRECDSWKELVWAMAKLNADE